MSEEDDPRFEFAFTAIEAAIFLGVVPATIRQWKRRGLVTEVGRDHKGRSLFNGMDLLTVERDTRVRRGVTRRAVP